MKLASVGVRALCLGHSRHLCLGTGLAAWIMGLELGLDPWTSSTNTPCRLALPAFQVCQQWQLLQNCLAA